MQTKQTKHAYSFLFHFLSFLFLQILSRTPEDLSKVKIFCHSCQKEIDATHTHIKNGNLL